MARLTCPLTALAPELTALAFGLGVRAALDKNYKVTCHPCALKYFKEHSIAAKSHQ